MKIAKLERLDVFAENPELVDKVQYLCQMTNQHSELNLLPIKEMFELRELVPWLVNLAGNCLSQAV